MTRKFLAIGLLAGAFALSACTSNTLSYDDPRIDDDGTYPNLNYRSAAAAEPLGEAEAQATINTVSAAKPRTGRPSSSTYQTEQLRQIGRTHGEEAIRVIEASGE